jgi:uncharacterized hydrophobic protein (TIGR00341 family)
MEVFIPGEHRDAVREVMSSDKAVFSWEDDISESGFYAKILLKAEQTESILDELEKRCSNTEKFRVVLLPVEATLPREEDANQSTEPKINQPMRISREELYNDIVDNSKFTPIYAAMVVLSAIVAAVGLLRNNTAMIIGAMVIAPLLGPNVGLALATTLGDLKLGLQALKTNILGIIIALTLAVVAGILFPIDPGLTEIASRTQVAISDVVLALASGTAGVLAFTSGASGTLIGVMVAVALLPPLIVIGLLLGSSYFNAAAGATLLLTTNVICINLAAVVTFWIQGVKPKNWWEKGKASKATKTAILIWSGLLLLLITIILYSQYTGLFQNIP